MLESSDITGILRRWSRGDREAVDELVPVVYSELKRLAHARLRMERQGRTLDTTGLVHEAYLRLVEIDEIDWNDRNHFWSMAARVMRRILVDTARKRNALKRGAGVNHRTTDGEWLAIPDTDLDRFLDLESALSRLEQAYPRAANVVELCFFAGLSQKEAGDALGISQPTVARDLRFARAWLTMDERIDSVGPRV